MVIKQGQNNPEPPKDKLNPSQIQHENRHSDGVRCCFFQLCTDPPHAAFALRKAEAPFNLHAFAVLVVIEDLRRIVAGLLREDLRTVQEKLRCDAVDGLARADPVGDSVRFYISY